MTPEKVEFLSEKKLKKRKETRKDKIRKCVKNINLHRPGKTQPHHDSKYQGYQICILAVPKDRLHKLAMSNSAITCQHSKLHSSE